MTGRRYETEKSSYVYGGIPELSGESVNEVRTAYEVSQMS